MISSDRLNIKQIRAHWDEILRLATSIKQGTVTASLMLRSSAAIRVKTAWP
jgi:TnpA family transposase